MKKKGLVFLVVLLIIIVFCLSGCGSLRTSYLQAKFDIKQKIAGEKAEKSRKEAEKYHPTTYDRAQTYMHEGFVDENIDLFKRTYDLITEKDEFDKIFASFPVEVCFEDNATQKRQMLVLYYLRDTNNGKACMHESIEIKNGALKVVIQHYTVTRVDVNASSAPIPRCIAVLMDYVEANSLEVELSYHN